MKNPIENLNKVFDSRIRLGIMSAVMVNEEVNFNDLKELIQVTDGNLASHLKTLEENGYIKVQKGFIGRKTNTTYSVTKVGEKAFKAQLDALEQMVTSMKQIFLSFYFEIQSTFKMKKNIISAHFAAVIVTTIIIMLVYAVAQQQYRTSANDPQVQIANELCSYLEQGKSIDAFFAGDTIDLNTSLLPFTVLYNADGKPVRTTALLNKQPPQLPAGVLQTAALQKENRVTWQPQPGIKMATVIKRVNLPVTAYVMCGRSLYETEQRTSNLIRMISLAWVTCMLVIMIHGAWMLKNNS